jgi:hypothetical protein
MEDLATALHDLLEQVDQDCPDQYRTKHLNQTMEDARNVLYGYLSTGGKLIRVIPY